MVERIRYRIKIVCIGCGAHGVARLSEDDFPYGGMTCRSTEWVSEGFKFSDKIRCTGCEGAVNEIDVAPSSREKSQNGDRKPSSSRPLARRRSKAPLEPV